MPASFGFFVMFMVLYVFGSKTGCHFMNWMQKVFFREKRNEVVPSNMSHHASITTFLEFNLINWACYLYLMFIYDPEFFGDSHPVTIASAVGCVIGAVFMFRHQLKLRAWGPNIRMSIATVIVFWTAVEVFARNGMFTEIWVEPLHYVPQMISILVVFILLGVGIAYKARTKKAGH